MTSYEYCCIKSERGGKKGKDIPSDSNIILNDGQEIH